MTTDRKKLNGAKHYTLRFPPGQLPPVNAFWSLALYLQHDSPGADQESNWLSSRIVSSGRGACGELS